MAVRVLSGLLFYPRGGSAHTARALTRELRRLGASVTLLAGSRSGLGGHGDARSFYGDVHAVDFDPALGSPRPLGFEGPAGTAPMHPSYEDRPGAPDVVFASVDDQDYERQVQAWARELERAGASQADVLLLHHLTPLHEAAARAAPRVPIITQLHGTELLMLERIEAGAPAGWVHAEAWAARLRGWAQASARLVVTPSGAERARRLLGVDARRLVELPSGVDTEVFRSVELDREAFWRRRLVEEPRGWLPGQDAGSIRYQDPDVAELARGVVILYVGRFTAVKRLDYLIGAFARARRHARTPAALVLVGGHPGEWEGEHPAQLAQRVGAAGVYLAGWQEHERLPEFFAAGDLFAATSECEQFGLAMVEGMACGLPVVATRSPGPELILQDGETGWLVDGHDEHALVEALVAAIDSPDERRRRGLAAARTVAERFSWSEVARALSDLVAEVIRSAPPASPLAA